jgi:hypothetical protein
VRLSIGTKGVPTDALEGTVRNHRLFLSALAGLALVAGTLLLVPTASAAYDPDTAGLPEDPVPATSLSTIQRVDGGDIDVLATMPGNDTRWTSYVNTAYECEGSGHFWFVVVERIADAPTLDLHGPGYSDDEVLGTGRVRPLWVTFVGVNLALRDDEGDLWPDAVFNNVNEPPLTDLGPAIVAGMGTGTLGHQILELGYRGLVPGTCDTDALTGLGTTAYPTPEQPGNTVDGAINAMAAIEYLAAGGTAAPPLDARDAPLRPTSHIVLQGGSAGSYGAYSTMYSFRHSTETLLDDLGVPVTATIMDSGIPSDRLWEIWLADGGRRVPAPAIPNAEFVDALPTKLTNPALQTAHQPQAALINDIDVPMLAIYDRQDFACAGDPVPNPPDPPEEDHLSDRPGYDGSNCDYAFSLFADAIEPGDLHAVHSYDLAGTSGGPGWRPWSNHIPLSDVSFVDTEAPFGQPDTSARFPHPAIGDALDWVAQVRAEHPATPWPYLPVHGFEDIELAYDPLAHRSLVDAISWAADRGVMTPTTGCAAGVSPCFNRDAVVSRQAMSAFLYRLHGSPAFAPPATPSFSDVGTGHTFRTEIEWMKAEGISTGYPTGCSGTPPCYKPADPVSRQAMSAFLYRAVGEPTSSPGAAIFSDVSSGHPFFHEIQWMAHSEVSLGYATGCSGTPPCYKPSANVTRQAMAQFLHRIASFGDAWDPADLPALEDRDALTF